jgi:alkylated DNA repair dioxygenase AlkB
MPRSAKNAVATMGQTLSFAPPAKTITKRKYSRSKGETHAGLKPIPAKFPQNSLLSDFSYNPVFLSTKEQGELIEHLNKLPWQKVTYTKFGKPRSTPRHTFCFGTPAADGSPILVSYKGHYYTTEALPDWLQELKKKVETATNYAYNAVILNNYIDAGEYISWHTDDERFLQHTTVASISLGASRTFKVRQNWTPEGDKEKTDNKSQETAVSLVSGSLAVLFRGIEHTLPKETPTPYNGMHNRFNITFRCLKPFQAGEKMSGWGNYYHYNRGSKYEVLQPKQSK